jgi:hypothetical protein
MRFVESMPLKPLAIEEQGLKLVDGPAPCDAATKLIATTTTRRPPQLQRPRSTRRHWLYNDIAVVSFRVKNQSVRCVLDQSYKRNDGCSKQTDLSQIGVDVKTSRSMGWSASRLHDRLLAQTKNVY